MTMFNARRTTSLIPVRIGALLISANVIRPDMMANSLLIARQTGRRIGDVLVGCGHVTQEELKCALDLQRLIKEGSITVEMGTRALRLARDQERSLSSALEEVGYSDQKTIDSNDLATVLLEAGCITQAQLQQASWNAAKNYLPIGRNLVLCGTISPSTLGNALNALIYIRDGVVAPAAAIEGLRSASQKKISFEEAIGLEAPLSPNHVKVGELLSSAGLLSDSDAMTAVERGLLNQRSIGQVLLESQMVSPLVLDAVLKLQKMIEEQKMSKTQAAELLRQVATKQVRLEDFLSEMAYLKTRVLQLLLASSVITDAQVNQALSASSQQENDLVRALFQSGVLQQDVFRTAVRCVYSINEGSMDEPSAITYLQATFCGPALDDESANAMLETA